MPSQRHESLVELFRNRPSLAAELLREAFHLQVPGHADARVESADFTDIQPTEYRADLVVLLSEDAPVLGIVIDVQFARDERKPFVWPVYATTLRARFECPVRLLVVAMTEAVARWAAAPIHLDDSNVYTPLVLDRTRVPEILDESQALADPELAVLSAIAYGKDADTQKSVQIALNAQKASRRLPTDRRQLYIDLVRIALSEAARELLKKMDMSTYEYQSDFGRECVAHGKRELLLKQLTLRFGTLSAAQQARIRQASLTELDAIGKRVLTASTLRQALNVKRRRPGARSRT